MSNQALRLLARNPAPVALPRVPLGRYLVDNGVVTPDQLVQALQMQLRLGAPIGEILVSEGWARAGDVLAALAQQYNMYRVDLTLQPPDPGLCGDVAHGIWLQHRAIAWMRVGRTVLIATARPEGAPEGSKGLGLYLVPSHVDEDWVTPNDYQVTYLKEKIGTRALATGEIELEGALAYEIAAPPEGLRVMMEALGCSRVHNAMAAAAVMRRALGEALAWVCNREVFGKRLIAQPMVRKRIVELAVRWHAGCAMAFEAAYSFDKAFCGGDDYVWSRIVTALAKYKTAEDALWCAQKALSLVAGNGYTEDYPVARLFRDAMVLPVWEGPEQIQALELMRMITGRQSGDRVFLERLNGIVAELDAAGLEIEKDNLEAVLADMRAALEALRARPEHAEVVAGDFLHKMSDLVAYALLCREAVWELENQQDRSKRLVCECYYKSMLTLQNAPSFERHALMEHFDAFIGGQPIPA